jgi:hypothetical protein
MMYPIIFKLKERRHTVGPYYDNYDSYLVAISYAIECIHVGWDLIFLKVCVVYLLERFRNDILVTPR